MREPFNAIDKITGCFVQVLDQLIMPRGVSIIRFCVSQKGLLSLQHFLFRGFDIEESHVRSRSTGAIRVPKKKREKFQVEGRLRNVLN